MKATLISFLICICYCTSAQIKISKDGKGFNSYFQKMEKGNFVGHADGIMLFEYSDGTKFSSSFSQDLAQLNILPDAKEIYDVSTKNYIIKNNNIQIKYSTYNWANALFITIGDKIYSYTLFDGDCSRVINGLDYKYIQAGDTELLVIHFSDKVGLCSTKGYTSPVFYIQKGSTIIFYIKKKLL